MNLLKVTTTFADPTNALHQIYLSVHSGALNVPILFVELAVSSGSTPL